MSLMIVFVKRTVVCLIALALVYVVPTLANPNNYPQFAQQQVDPAIPIFYWWSASKRSSMRAVHPCWWMCSVEEYNAGHLPAPSLSHWSVF